MALPETFTHFARTAAEQLRWKAARPLVEDELLTHLCDQRDALMAGGMDEAAAAAESLRLTGDPYEIGTALDRVHRPKTPKLLFALAALIALAGLAFTALVSFRDYELSYFAVHQSVALLLGTAALLAAYFLDFTLLGRFALPLALVFHAALILLGLLPIGGFWLRYIYVSTHILLRGLPLLFVEGFLLMGAFVTLFNYIGYRLMMSPWSLSQAVVGLLSVAYLTGTWSSPKAGAMTVRYGRGPVMLGFTGVMLCGLLMTLFSSLWLIFIGMLLFSAGFFAAHSVASSWIGPRARRARGQASSLYLFSYYLGSSLAGTLGGVFWHRYGWNGVGGFIALLLLAALLTGTCLYRRLK